MKDKVLLEQKRIKRQNLINKIRRIFIGMNFNDGLIFKVLIWILLISFSYVYLYPLLFMVSNSVKSVSDLIDPGIKWIPTSIEIDNYVKAWKVIGMPDVVFESTWFVLKLAIFSTLTSALVGFLTLVFFILFLFPFFNELVNILLFPRLFVISIDTGDV